MLGTLEHTGVWAVGAGDELSERDDTLGVDLLDSLDGSGIRDSVELQVVVFIEKTLEVVTDEVSLLLVTLGDSLPDEIFLALGGHSLVGWGIEVLLVLHIGALAIFIAVVDALNGVGTACGQGQNSLEFHHKEVSY